MNELIMKKLNDITRKRLVKDAANAMSDLYIFHAIIVILEGGTIQPASYRSAQFIIRHCQEATARCLARYDAACERLGVANP